MNIDKLKSELRVGAITMTYLSKDNGALLIDETEAARIAKAMNDAVAAIDAQQAPAIPQAGGEYPPLPDTFFSDYGVWGLIGDWSSAAGGRHAEIAGQKIDEAIKQQMRAYLDADRAAIAAHQARALEGVEPVHGAVANGEVVYSAATVAALQAQATVLQVRIAALEQDAARKSLDENLWKLSRHIAPNITGAVPFLPPSDGLSICSRHDYSIVEDPTTGCPKCNAESAARSAK